MAAEDIVYPGHPENLENMYEGGESMDDENRLLAGKFQSHEALEEGYQNLQSHMSRLEQDNQKLRQMAFENTTPQQEYPESGWAALWPFQGVGQPKMGERGKESGLK